ncbi:uncharacterized protein BO87DRAFT_424874 [Aspergillus neoniger CBS 115656]|uniref:Uncharacterized protein n=1 Tax=Aspergillus neoniger (strain CBS 115656) TaxID=1448310 RepID=A0A318YTP8_ASPNB|nr:hypothetical protein BO87DRAFT_424874 [Aspergillus neoniger CBS 115656]PYH35380.1 hypothetical protein BO87DRAFT_424874 [Aspergillus neoniger CBS 115656]
MRLVTFVQLIPGVKLSIYANENCFDGPAPDEDDGRNGWNDYMVVDAMNYLKVIHWGENGTHGYLDYSALHLPLPRSQYLLRHLSLTLDTTIQDKTQVEAPSWKTGSALAHSAAVPTKKLKKL